MTAETLGMGCTGAGGVGWGGGRGVDRGLLAVKDYSV